jgi:hypothetical protein
MKGHFKVEAWIMWSLAAIGVVVAFVAAFVLPHLVSWH